MIANPTFQITARHQKGKERHMAPQTNAVAWFEIYVNDMPRAKAFYESVFQVKLESLADPEGTDMQMWAFPMEMSQWGAGGALVKMEGMKAGVGGTMVYFACEDVAVEAARIVPAGGKLDREKTSIGQYGFMAIAYDTEGNMIGLHSTK
jgi:predicted enzyme related to lactoylglutathione lyase